MFFSTDVAIIWLVLIYHEIASFILFSRKDMFYYRIKSFFVKPLFLIAFIIDFVGIPQGQRPI